MQNNTVIYPCMMNMFSFKIVMRCWLCKLAFLVVLSLVTPQHFQLSFVSVIFIWADFWSVVRFVSCQWSIGIRRLDLNTFLLRRLEPCGVLCSDVALGFQFQLFSVFLRSAEYLSFRDILSSSRYSICLFCQHNIHLLIYTYITHAYSHLSLILGCILCLFKQRTCFFPSRMLT